MKKYIYYSLLALSAMTIVSCSDDDEILEPSVGYVDNKFAVPDDATGPEAELRRDFYKRTGAYLLFNDLLGREYLGLDAEGNEVWRDDYIDFRYNLTDYSAGDAPEINFLETQEDKEKATELVEKYVWSRIDGSKLAPFSVMIVNDIWAYSFDSYRMVKSKTVSCFRCMAIATDELMAAQTDEERDEVIVEIIRDIVGSKFTPESDAAEDFMDISYEHAYDYLDDIYDDWEDNPDVTRVYDLGFLSYIASRWGDYLPRASDDFDEYVSAVIGEDETEFMDKYGEYPLIVTKYRLIKNALISLGLKF